MIKIMAKWIRPSNVEGLNNNLTSTFKKALFSNFVAFKGSQKPIAFLLR